VAEEKEKRKKRKKEKEIPVRIVYKGFFWINIKCKSRHILRKESDVAIFRQ
jgi:hypothetical protein